MSRAITIGRNPNSMIRISEDYDIVSNDHAEITQQGVEIVYTDHSSNGTIINGQKIQGKSVNIYRGDKIVLAGVYELQWSLIDPLIVPVGRPTVARNIRGDAHLPSDGQPRYSGHSRPTEVYSSSKSSNIQEPSYNPVPNSRLQSMYIENRSSTVQIERELGKWNWGAFYFGWIWGVFNKTWISTIDFGVWILSIYVQKSNTAPVKILIPSLIIFIIWLGLHIWFGIKGNIWAWQNKRWRNIEHFHKIQKRWAIVGLVIMFFFVVLCSKHFPSLSFVPRPFSFIFRVLSIFSAKMTYFYCFLNYYCISVCIRCRNFAP